MIEVESPLAEAVALDLDGDGRESTGWVLLYYHLAAFGVTG